MLTGQCHGRCIYAKRPLDVAGYNPAPEDLMKYIDLKLSTRTSSRLTGKVSILQPI
jgi:hypothetical protein